MSIVYNTRLTLERRSALIIREELTEQEHNLLYKMLYNREAGLLFNFKKYSKVWSKVAFLQEIYTIKYQVWQLPRFLVPRALNRVVTNIVKEQLNNNILELYYRLYKNPWFLVEKKNKKYCFINTAIKINKVTIYNTNLPPSINKFSEDFAKCVVALLIDFFSGYN